MQINRIMSSVLAIVLFVCVVMSPAFAENGTGANKVLSREVIELTDGAYIVEEIVETTSMQINRATSTKSGYKNSTFYTASNVAVFTVRVSGSFEYTGTSSKATSSTATVYLNNSAATYVSKSAFCSGISAYATGTVSYSGQNLTRSVALSCSATGVLS